MPCRSIRTLCNFHTRTMANIPVGAQGALPSIGCRVFRCICNGNAAFLRAAAAMDAGTIDCIMKNKMFGRYREHWEAKTFRGCLFATNPRNIFIDDVIFELVLGRQLVLLCVCVIMLDRNFHLKPKN